VIFISYAREDQKRATKIFEILQNYGHEIFFDQNDLIPGMDWRLEIETKLESSRLILILCSKHSIQKTGFVQKELRIALDKADMMPEGKILIIPVRFDRVEMPSKIRKYQWLEIESENDYHNVQFFLDAAIKKSSKSDGNPIRDATGRPPHEQHVMKEFVVVLMVGKNNAGEPIYVYIRTPVWKFYELAEFVKTGGDFIPSSYGEIVASGLGEPSHELRQKMREEHTLVDVPYPGSENFPLNEAERAAFREGFENAYRCIRGTECNMPYYSVPIVLKFGQSPLREGIRAALEVAKIRP
jgi:hypothetical protein